MQRATFLCYQRHFPTVNYSSQPVSNSASGWVRVRRPVGGSASLSTLTRRAGNKSWVILSFHSSNAKLSRTSAAPSARPPASGCRPSRPPPTPVVPQIADLFGPGDAADRSPLPSRQLRPQRQGGVTARHDLSKGRKVGGQDFSLF